MDEFDRGTYVVGLEAGHVLTTRGFRLSFVWREVEPDGSRGRDRAGMVVFLFTSLLNACLSVVSLKKLIETCYGAPCPQPDIWGHEKR